MVAARARRSLAEMLGARPGGLRAEHAARSMLRRLLVQSPTTGERDSSTERRPLRTLLASNGVPIVNFLQYRQHAEARTQANNAIMALLAGSQLAAHTLQLTDGSDRLLPEIFPRVTHIDRFNLKTSTAKDLLTDAELHLGAMSVPYVLALHEDFGNTALRLLGERPRKAATLHSALGTRLSTINWGASEGAFHVARILRNSMIHSGGRLDSQSITEFAKFVDPSGRAEWRRLAARDPLKLAVGDLVQFAHGELIAVLSITKGLAKLINFGLQAALPRKAWAHLLIDDLAATEPRHLADPDKVRKCLGYARHFYGPIALTRREIEQALADRGY